MLNLKIMVRRRLPAKDLEKPQIERARKKP